MNILIGLIIGITLILTLYAVGRSGRNRKSGDSWPPVDGGSAGQADYSLPPEHHHNDGGSHGDAGGGDGGGD